MAASSQPTKKKCTQEVIMEWDIVRRTAEFFDNILGGLRALGLTASLAMLGAALQFGVFPLFVALFFLGAGFLAIDLRYQSYLKATAKYAMQMEKDYGFASEIERHGEIFAGLTLVIDDESKRWKIRPEEVFQLFYILMLIAGAAVSFYIYVPQILTLFA